ncbi:peptidoglycan DD-metalloendopeptidase family protein [Cohnella sp. AR92]|uniref:peptidoglycan DD-metalloendopeptidase family protein n=1 Tax=Cohnella sp. AR92 TaxID=648716 RepID=UPI000F8E0E22|nr:M23 family metallopeptidase [Cohnella sp. AR92]RUS48727.1 M23 family metallopeptidase [Cohnella sp. AR92]
MRWSRNKYTVVIIPDASRPVQRIAVPSYLIPLCLTLVPILMIFLLTACLVLYRHFDNNADKLSRLQQKMNASSSRYEEILQDKDTSIDYLQTQIVGLTEQAAGIHEKLAEMDRLEGQVRELMGLPVGESDEVHASEWSDSALSLKESSLSDIGKGGVEIPATDEEFQQYLDSAKRKFQNLSPALSALEIRLENMQENVQLVQEKQKATPSIWPTDSRDITSKFGIRLDPFTHRARYHAGIDFSGDIGDPIYATADGTVIWSQRDGEEGNNIKIEHGDGLLTRYMHLSKRIAQVGDKVEKGDLIGLLGNTGRSTGPHLHYEVHLNGKQIDPMPYLPIIDDEGEDSP